MYTVPNLSGKQGYEEGALVFYSNHNGYMGQYRIAEDVVFKFCSLGTADMQPYVQHHWELKDKKDCFKLSLRL